MALGTRSTTATTIRWAPGRPRRPTSGARTAGRPRIVRACADSRTTEITGAAKTRTKTDTGLDARQFSNRAVWASTQEAGRAKRTHFLREEQDVWVLPAGTGPGRGFCVGRPHTSLKAQTGGSC